MNFVGLDIGTPDPFLSRSNSTQRRRGRFTARRRNVNSPIMDLHEMSQFTELTACSTCGTLWKREFKGAAEQLEIVAKRLRREPHLTDPPNGHRIVFWKCHTCGADHIDDSWAELLATVGVRDNVAATTPSYASSARAMSSSSAGPPTNPFQGQASGSSPPQLLRPPVPQR
ncbi:hypothetical protein Vafri_18951 [Volvox africanus]|uniref:Uncharacterized protein n=1 Tax=Volvox africanus TaxID=51714 RepID=A0A8J4BM59_9CHLO|nr:hypothetical protein Vafri_18951 [Volvox africanus]